MSHFMILAVMQTSFHLIKDYDRIELPVMRTVREGDRMVTTKAVVPPMEQLSGFKLFKLAEKALRRSVAMVIAGPIIYTYFVRDAAWAWTLTFAKLVWTLPKSTALPGRWPFQAPLLFKCFVSGFLLVFMWEVANAAFSAYAAQAPLKNERPITFESKDPNGSLISGLKGKKLQTRVRVGIPFYLKAY
jgi:nucleoporin NDC1